MPRVTSLLNLPLRLGGSALSAGASVAGRSLQLVRGLTGQGRGGGSPQQQAAASTPAPSARPPRMQPQPAGRTDEPVRPQEEVKTVGRGARERKEPTPEPATGSTAAQASGRRRASTPKSATAVRKRGVKAAALETVETGPSSGRGGTPQAAAENTPKERARAKQGREPAPMGSNDEATGAGDES